MRSMRWASTRTARWWGLQAWTRSVGGLGTGLLLLLLHLRACMCGVQFTDAGRMR